MTSKEFFEKYGEVKVKFDHYYKYTFHYVADLPDGSKLTCAYGGDSDDIYRFDVEANKEITVAHLLPYKGLVYIDDKEIEWFEDIS